MKTRLSLWLLWLAALIGSPLHAEPSSTLSLPLQEVEQLVVQRNRALIGARRATAAGEAGVDTAGARPNPVISLNPSKINGRRPMTGGNTDTTLRIDQPIERGNKRDLRLSVADALLQANRADESDNLRQQTLLARQAYFDLKSSEEKSRLGFPYFSC